MSDLQRSLLFLAGIAAGLVAGLSGSAEPEMVPKRRPNPASVASVSEAKVADSAVPPPREEAQPSGLSSPAARPALSARLADWWQRALALRPGEAPALFREIENEMGTKLLGTFYVLAAGRDPEGTLAVYREFQARGIQAYGNALFRSWALRDAAAAKQAALTMPDEDRERWVNIIDDIAKREAPPKPEPAVLR